MSDNNEILEYFGQCLVEEVYDNALWAPETIVDGTTVNKIDQEKYKVLKDLKEEQREKIKELIRETTVDTIYRFLEMIEEHEDEFKLVAEKDRESYNLTDLSEGLSSEIVGDDDNWIIRYSKRNIK